MKKILLILCCLIGYVGYTQVHHNPLLVNPFTEPKCIILGVGYSQSVWSADYSFFGTPYLINADEFKNFGSYSLTLGMEFEGGSSEFSVGPFIFFSFAKDHWIGEFKEDYSQWLIRYEQSQLYYSGKIGAEVFYHFNKRWVGGLGAGLYVISAQSPNFTSDSVHLFSNNHIPDADLPNIVSSSSYSSFSSGVLLKGDIKYNITKSFFIGAQARFDLFPFYCSLSSNPRYIGFFRRLNNDNRSRLSAFFTCGYRF